MSLYYFLSFIQYEYIESQKHKLLCLFANLLTNSGHKSVTQYISSCFNNYSFGFKYMEIEKRMLCLRLIRTRNPLVKKPRNTCAIGWAKNIPKTPLSKKIISQFGV